MEAGGDTSQKLCLKSVRTSCTKKLLPRLKVRCVVVMNLTVVYKQSGSQLGTGKYSLDLSGLKYNAEDSHGAIR
jgi:hypothetical protein